MSIKATAEISYSDEYKKILDSKGKHDCKMTINNIKDEIKHQNAKNISAYVVRGKSKFMDIVVDFTVDNSGQLNNIKSALNEKKLE